MRRSRRRSSRHVGPKATSSCGRCGTTSRTDTADAVGIKLTSERPEAASSSPNSAWVRSRAVPNMAIIWISSRYPDGCPLAGSGFNICSTISRLALEDMAARQFARIRTQSSSDQSCRTRIRRYMSAPDGTRSKKLPCSTSIRPFKRASAGIAATTSSRSNTKPRGFGNRASIRRSVSPLPPPRSTISAAAEKSYEEATALWRSSGMRAMNASNIRPSSGCSLRYLNRLAFHATWWGISPRSATSSRPHAFHDPSAVQNLAE